VNDKVQLKKLNAEKDFTTWVQKDDLTTTNAEIERNEHEKRKRGRPSKTSDFQKTKLQEITQKRYNLRKR